MAPVDQSNFEISFGGSHSAMKGKNDYKAPETLTFTTAIELLKYLDSNESRQPRIQTEIQRRLSKDVVAITWHKQRTPSSALCHFPRYRQNKYYETYHEAARCVAKRCGTDEQHQRVAGLNQEIRESSVVVPSGQILFHGRASADPLALPNHPSFISTSLDPTVAIFHAIKRAESTNSHPLIYVLTVRDSLNAMWGNGDGFEEWELLLQSGLTCCQNSTSTLTRFTIIEASIG